MPGVLMLEALAQAAALLVVRRRIDVDARRQDGVLLRRHRRRALQAAGRAGRPADARRRRSTACKRGICKFTGARHGRRRARRRGRADVHDAHASPERRAAWRRSIRRRIVDRRRRARPHGRGRPVRGRSAPHVRIGAGTTVGAHCVIEGRTTIGRDNRIFQFASLGARAAGQEVRAASRPSSRSATATPSASSAPSTAAPRRTPASTRIGDDNWIMAYVHIAHDCQVGSHTIFANNAHARRPRARRRLGRSSAG